VNDRERALAALDAFADVERPANADLLHPQCMDDGDLLELYEVGDWREMSDQLVIGSYAAPSFLSADGFRYFLPAFMRYALRNPTSPEIVAESIIFHLGPGEWDEFGRSKLASITPQQAGAIRLFLKAMSTEHDTGAALALWDGAA
jgi:hypothetical protein